MDDRQQEFGLRLAALGICFVNLGLVFSGLRDGFLPALCLFVAGGAIVATGAIFYWGGRWEATPGPTLLEVPNTVGLACLLGLTGLGAALVTGNLAGWAGFALSAVIAARLALYVRRHLAGR